MLKLNYIIIHFEGKVDLKLGKLMEMAASTLVLKLSGTSECYDAV
jgi:hypothetical protein